MWRHKRLRETIVTVLAYQFMLDDAGYIRDDVPDAAAKIMADLPNNYEFVVPFEPDEALVLGADAPDPVTDVPPSDDPSFGVQKSRTPVKKERKRR